ncbi:MAG: prepilin peptidase [Candidatus Izimaplasma sp.]|nr:prepilin peptidase [Candidatus Izimaplasma bacterium]
MFASKVIITLLFGNLLGSFFNVLGIRLPNNQTILGRSQCSNCKKQLNWYELIPVFSYIFLKGKCSKCGSKISIIHPIIELITGLIFGISYYYLHNNIFELSIVLLFSSLMIIVTVCDIYYRTVPNIFLIIFTPIILVLRIIYPVETIIHTLLGGFLGFGFMYLLAIYGKKRFNTTALGGGDIKLYFVIGIFLGVETVFLSLFFAAIYGIIFSKVVKFKNGQIPFVPFIFAGTMTAYVFGSQIIDWYLGILF